MEACRKIKENEESEFFLLRFICFFNLEHVSSWYPYLTGERSGVAETAERFETWR